VTIPVDNRPQYEPGAPPPPPSDEEARELAQRTAVETQLRLQEEAARAAPRRSSRGCLLSAGVLGLLGSVVGAFFAWALCSGGIDAAFQQTGRKISDDLRMTAEQQGSLETHREALDHLDRLRNEDRVTWIAFSILFNRWTDSGADRQVTEEELTRLMELVRDIDAHEGDVDPAVYPDGR